MDRHGEANSLFSQFCKKLLKVCENAIHHTDLDVANFSIFLGGQNELVTTCMSPSMNSAQAFKTVCTFHLGFARESVTVSNFTSPQKT